MHKNYNSCLHILDMHVERGETSVFTLKTNSSFNWDGYRACKAKAVSCFLA